MIFLERRRSLKNLYFLVCFYQISRWISNMNFDQVHLHVSLNPDVWPLRPRMHVLLASKCPTRKSIMIRPAGKKPLQNRALQLHKTCDAAGQLSSDGSGRVQRAQVLQVHRCTALHLHLRLHRRVGPGPPKARFLGLRPTEGEREPAQKCISSNVLRGDSCPSLIRPIYAS